MSQPPPMELIDRGDTIQMRMEEYDTIRTFHMRPRPTRRRSRVRRSATRSAAGTATTLVVETTRVRDRYLNATGVPLGAERRFVERFTPTADGSRLDYTLDVTDPDSLAAPARFLRTWVWRPGEQVLPYNCKE